MNKLLPLVFLAVCVAAGPTNQPSQSKNLNCFESSNSIISCFFVKAAFAVDKASRSSKINVIDGVTFERTTPLESVGRSLEKSEFEIISTLPHDQVERVLALLRILCEPIASFVKNYTLKFAVPEGSIGRILNEGQFKFKKLFASLVSVLSYKMAALIPILLGGLSLLVVKALAIGKTALFIAGAMAAQKFFGNSNVASIFDKKPTYGNWHDSAPASWSADGLTGLQNSAYNQLEHHKSYNANPDVNTHDTIYSAYAPSQSF